MGNSMIKATGKQGLGALIAGSGYFVLGIPLAYYFAFVKMLGISGLWRGFTIATLYIVVCYNVLIFRIDWPNLIDEIIQR